MHVYKIIQTKYMFMQVDSSMQVDAIMTFHKLLEFTGYPRLFWLVSSSQVEIFQSMVPEVQVPCLVSEAAVISWAG